jgi:hypothetical protein
MLQGLQEKVKKFGCSPLLNTAKTDDLIMVSGHFFKKQRAKRGSK